MKKISMKKLMIILLSVPFLGTVATISPADKAPLTNGQLARLEQAERDGFVAEGNRDRQQDRQERLAAAIQVVDEELLARWEREFQGQPAYPNVQEMTYVPMGGAPSLHYCYATRNTQASSEEEIENSAVEDDALNIVNSAISNAQRSDGSKLN